MMHPVLRFFRNIYLLRGRRCVRCNIDLGLGVRLDDTERDFSMLEMIEGQIAEDGACPPDRTLNTSAAFNLDDEFREGFLRQIFCKGAVPDQSECLPEQTVPARVVELRHVLQNEYS
jgi:hypothetical protein